MKTKNVQKRLNARISEWENLKASDSKAPNKKTIHKPSGGVLEFTKPGSLKKKG
jgi:hypothetical protein